MANSYFFLELDTTSPNNVSLTINGGATYATSQLVTLSIGTSDSTVDNYQMKIWSLGIDTAFDTNIQDTEAKSSWVSFNNSKQVKLSSGDGNKVIYLKIRDDVHNESSQTSDSIVLDTSVATVSVSNPDVNKLSKMPNKNTANFSFTSDKDFTQYTVKVVSATSAIHSTGTLIGTANGSTNTSGTGTFAKGTPISVSIRAEDLEIANSGDGQKLLKVFVLDNSTKWSL